MATAAALNAEPTVHVLSTIGSERATSGGGNKIVTHENKTHVVWQDSTPQGYFNRIRTLDRDTNTWLQTVTLNEGKDNHARPVVTIDHEGYLHVIMSGHHSPVTHRRSVRPNDASEWTDPQDVGRGTYPVVVCGADDTLYATMRSDRRWNGVDLYVKPKDGPWEKRGKLVKRREDLPGYAAFHSGMAVGPDGTLHLVSDFYEGKGIYDQRGLHQAVCYMQSRDRGQTWQRADGTAVSIPARPEDMDILAQDERERGEEMPPPLLLSMGAIVTDLKGRAHILYISHLDAPGQLVHAWTDNDGAWQRQTIDAVAESFPDHRPTHSRGALSKTADGDFYALLTLQPLNDQWQDGKPTRESNWNAENKRLILLHSPDSGRTWDAQLALPEDREVNQPNVERPTGVNLPSGGQVPPFVYFDGLIRYPEKGETIQNNVYLVMPATQTSTRP